MPQGGGMQLNAGLYMRIPAVCRAVSCCAVLCCARCAHLHALPVALAPVHHCLDEARHLQHEGPTRKACGSCWGVGHTADGSGTWHGAIKALPPPRSCHNMTHSSLPTAACRRTAWRQRCCALTSGSALASMPSLSAEEKAMEDCSHAGRGEALIISKGGTHQGSEGGARALPQASR